MIISNVFLFMIILTLINSLPEDFIYLTDLSKKFCLDIKYSQKENFMNKRISGYRSKNCILTKKAAKKLIEAQKELADFSKKKVSPLTFIIYDCYRPMKAIDEMIEWSLTGKENYSMKNYYYPRISKKDIVQKKYIDESFDHNRGSTIALSIILKSSIQIKKPLNYNFPCHVNNEFRWISDPSVDMGTSYDCFDNVSFSNYTNLPYPVLGNRKFLTNLMKRFGFKLTSNQSIFHYTLIDEPFINQEFDFDIENK